MLERILIVDDSPELCLLLKTHLQQKGFKTYTATDGRQALKLAYKEQPNLVILDLMMPEMDGFQVCQRLLEMSDVPIIILSARDAEDDIVRAFECGADDYVTKPFRLRELEERVKAVLRRVAPYKQINSLAFDDGLLKIDLDRQQVWRRGQMVHLTPTEFRLLSGLLRRKGSVVSHKELLAEVWGPGYEDATACLSLYIRYIREKLEENPAEPEYIKTKWGTGYMFLPNGHKAG